MRLLFPVPDGEPGDAQDFGATKCPKDRRTAEPVEEPRQGLGKLGLEGGAERLRAVL